jgi:ferritin
VLSENMAGELNKQIQAELYSGHLYLAMAAYCNSLDLDGFANFFIVQEKEERDHAMKIYRYLADQGNDVKIYGLDEPQGNYENIEHVFDSSWKHEQKVSARFNHLMALAKKEDDFATQNFLQWFIGEQVEEEASMLSILKKIQMVGGTGHGILMLDSELAQRQFTPLTAEE